jgi:hypothetical protein
MTPLEVWMAFVFGCAGVAFMAGYVVGIDKERRRR